MFDIQPKAARESAPPKESLTQLKATGLQQDLTMPTQKRPLPEAKCFLFGSKLVRAQVCFFVSAPVVQQFPIQSEQGD
jgi:hypothetical protein